MARARLAHVEVWTDVACNSGTRKAVLQTVRTSNVTERIRGDDEVKVTCALGDASAAEITETRILRLVYAPDRNGTVDWSEWRIREVERAWDTGEVTITAESLIFDLERVGPMQTLNTSTGVVTFAESAIGATATEIIDNFILPALPAYWDRGTVEPTVAKDYKWDFLTPLGLLHLIERETGGEAQIRRNGTSGYYLDVVTERGSAQAIADFREGKQIAQITRGVSSSDILSEVIARGAPDPAGQPATLAHAVWEVTARDTGTDRYTLADPAGGDDPIAFDDQLNLLYLYDVSTGTTQVITDTFVATQQVAVADASVFSVGALLEVRASAGTANGDDAQLLVSLTNPSAPTTRIGYVDRPDITGERNLLGNGWFTDWSSGVDAAPDGYTYSSRCATRARRSTDPLYAQLGQYAAILSAKPRVRLTGSAAIGASAIPVDNTTDFGTSDRVILAGVFGGSPVTYTVASIATATLTFTSTLTANVSTSYQAGVEGAFPKDPTQGLISLTATSARAPVVTGNDLMHACASLYCDRFSAGMYARLTAKTPTTQSSVTTTVTGQRVFIACPIQPRAGEQVTVAVELFYPIDANPLYVLPEMAETPLNPAWNYFQAGARVYVDAIGLTHTDYAPKVIPNYSEANKLWAAANRALVRAATGAETYRVQLADLTALDDTSWPHDELVVGATVRLNVSALGLTDELVRIVEIQTDALDPANPTLVLASRKPDLTELLDDLLGLGGDDSYTTNAAPVSSSTTTIVPPPTSGGSTSGGGTPLPPSTGATIEVPILVPFHAGAITSDPTLTNMAQAETEIDTGLRCYIDLSNVSRVRLQGRVESTGATNSYLLCKFSSDNGTSWQPLDGVQGPFLPIDTAGDIRGPGTAITSGARGDVLLGLWSVDGDGTVDPTFGNLFLHTWYKTSGGPFPVPTTPTVPRPPGYCQYDRDTTGLGFLEDNWTAYADTAALLATIPGANAYTIWYGGTSGTSMGTTLTTGTTWHCHHTLAVTHGPTVTEGGWWSDLPNAYRHVWGRIRINMPTAWETPDSTSQTDTGLQLIELTGADSVGCGIVFCNDTAQGRVRLRLWSAQHPGTTPDLTADASGGLSLVAGAGMVDVILECRPTGANTYEVRGWVGPSDGSNYTRIGTLAPTYGAATTASFTDAEHFDYRYTPGDLASDQTLYVGDWEYVDGSAHPLPFGVLP
jgi:hypothetical protein